MTGWFPKSANATERRVETGRLTMNIVEAGSCLAVLTRPKGMKEIAALIPGAEYQLIPGSGHMIPVEQPARLAALLDAFLEAHLC
jgi:pimeloyl-ACP methyl ester carboxylesterase